jgi:hypothetical protein
LKLHNNFALRRQAHIKIMTSFITSDVLTSDEYLNVELDWDFDAETNDCEIDLEFLADSASLSIIEPINSNPMDFPSYPIEYSSDLPFMFPTETVAPPSYCQSPSDVHSVKTVSDTSSTDQSYYSTSETSLESLDQAFPKEKRRRPVKAAKKRAVTTRRSGWKKPKDAPKRYLSAYNIFFQEERRRVYAEADKRIGFSGLGKIIGGRWKSLTEEQREPYDIMAEKDIGRYRDEMKMYENARRRKYCRSSSSVTTASSVSDDTRCPSPDRVTPSLHPVPTSVMSQHQYTHHQPPPTVYAPQMIIPDQHHNGQYHAGGQYVGQQQQYAQPQVQYACYRMTRQEAQNYMQRYAGQHYAQSL